MYAGGPRDGTCSATDGFGHAGSTAEMFHHEGKVPQCWGTLWPQKALHRVEGLLCVHLFSCGIPC
jgi:hypothetical protein